MRTTLSVLVGWLYLASPVLASPEIVIVVGPSSHPPGTHEVAAGARLLKYCLENLESEPSLEVEIFDAWPNDTTPLSACRALVFMGDQFPGARLPESERIMHDLATLAARGCGMTALHYGVGLGAEDVDAHGEHPLLHWIGGYFATRCEHHQSIAKIYPAAEIEPAIANHPVSRGWDRFSLRGEPYINNYFGPQNNQMLPGAFPIATSQLPPDHPREEVIAWGIERKDGGRGIGLTLPHFFHNWTIEPLRTFILNSILWSGGYEIPQGGLQSKKLPALETFEPEAVHFTPRQP